jgi:predicted metalloendopeptidase
VENRDPVKVYNKLSVTELQKLTPSIQWQAWLKAQHAGIAIKGTGHATLVSARFTADYRPVQYRSLASLSDYTVTDAYAPYLRDAYTDAHFAFRGKVLSGIEKPQP